LLRQWAGASFIKTDVFAWLDRLKQLNAFMDNPLLTPAVGLIIWQVIIFVLLFLLLAKFAWKPIISSLKDRERSIQEALDTAEKARHEMSQLKSENEKLLQQAREERDRILREAREVSIKMREAAQHEAKKISDKIIEDARAAINIEKQAAMKEIKVQVAMFSLEIAEKLIKKNLSGDKAQKELVETYVKDLKVN
jgi:F-type H+-transporting ATPase subunit b